MNRVVLLLLVLVALVFSCTDEAPFKPEADRPLPIHVGQGLCPVKTVPEGEIVPGDIGPVSFYVMYGQMVKTEPPGLDLCLTQLTDQIFNCANFVIVEDIDLSKGLIEIRHLGIDNPELCLTALGPAVATDGFRLPYGDYTLRFVKGKLVDEWTLECRADGILIEPDGEPSYTTFTPMR